jgi:hypothetical protein
MPSGFSRKRQPIRQAERRIEEWPGYRADIGLIGALEAFSLRRVTTREHRDLESDTSHVIVNCVHRSGRHRAPFRDQALGSRDHRGRILKDVGVPESRRRGLPLPPMSGCVRPILLANAVGWVPE